MNKQEFLARLRKGLSGLPQEDVEERLTFYGEMVEDRMEEGLSEEEAVAAVGPVDRIVAQVVSDIPLARIAKERIRPKRALSTGEIVLLAVGAPLWLSLGIAVIAVLFSLYVSLWAVVVSLWAVFASFIACAGGGVVLCVGSLIGGNGAMGLAMLAAGMTLAGLAILMFYGCKAATKGACVLAKKSVVGIKNGLIRKEDEA